MKIAITAALLIIFTVSGSDAKIASLFVNKIDTDSLYLKAGLYEQNRDFEEASRLMEAVLEVERDEYVFMRLASIYRKLGDSTMERFTLERGLKANPESLEMMNSLAVVYSLDKKYYSEAKRLFKEAYDKSSNPIYGVRLAAMLAGDDDYNGAIKIYTELIKKFNRSEYYVQRGKLYMNLGLDNDSIADYEKAAEIDGNLFATTRLADYYLKKGNDDKAIKYLKMIIKQSPDMVLAKFRLAELLRKVGDTAAAVETYEAIVEKLNDKEKLYVLKQIAGVYYRDKNYEMAEAYFKRVYSIDKDVQTAYSLALMKEAAGDVNGAIEWYENILAESPSFNEAIKRLAIIYLRKGQADKANDIIDGVEDIYRGVDFYRIKAEALSGMNRIEDARATLRDAIKQNPSDDKLYIDLAISYESNGGYDEAIQVIKQGMVYHEDNPSYQNFLGYMYAQIGANLEEAKVLVEKALKAKPNEAAYLDSMAWVLFKMGQYKEAYDYQKRAVKLAPNEEEIRDHMKAIIDKLKLNMSVDDVINEN